MSAELLRRAASLMRERAEAATEGPWRPGRFFWKVGSTRGMPDEWWSCVETQQADVVASMPDEAAPSRPNAKHIASWHPAVALAVADWLEDEAETWEGYGDDDNDGIPFYRAYLVASAYLNGEDA